MPEISVVIPTKDRLPVLRGTIPMFLSHPEVAEVIVVADGCTDGTREYLAAASAVDRRIRYVDNVVNKGVTYSRNRAIDLASCEYLFSAEDDLELSPGFFGTLLAHLRQANADIVSARNIFRYGSETKEAALARADQIVGPPINKTLLTVQIDVDTGTDSFQSLLPGPMLGRTEIFRSIRFDDYFKGSAYREETDFQLAARAVGYKLLYCPHTTSFNWMIDNDRGGVHMVTGTRRARQNIRMNWYFINKHRDIISREFGAMRRYVNMIAFPAWMLFQLAAYPALMRAKIRLMGPRPLRTWIRRGSPRSAASSEISINRPE